MATATAPRKAAKPQIHQTQLLIDGKWTAAKSGKTFETVNPATEEVIANVAEGDAADVEAAVRAARKAFDEGPWPRMNARERGRIMLRLADLIEAEIDELAALESLDNGKPVKDARTGDIPLALDTLRY
jgi:aldehyde dehydrogenase (NAD+)